LIVEEAFVVEDTTVELEDLLLESLDVVVYELLQSVGAADV
jgi:hypothetical protein